MYGIIYRVTGPTGKVYIGKTTQKLEKRKQPAHGITPKHGKNTTPKRAYSSLDRRRENVNSHWPHGWNGVSLIPGCLWGADRAPVYRNRHRL